MQLRCKGSSSPPRWRDLRLRVLGGLGRRSALALTGPLGLSAALGARCQTLQALLLSARWLWRGTHLVVILVGFHARGRGVQGRVLSRDLPGGQGTLPHLALQCRRWFRMSRRLARKRPRKTGRLIVPLADSTRCKVYVCFEGLQGAPPQAGGLPQVHQSHVKKGCAGNSMRVPAASVGIVVSRHECSGCGGSHSFVCCFKAGRGRPGDALGKRDDASESGKEAPVPK